MLRSLTPSEIDAASGPLKGGDLMRHAWRLGLTGNFPG